MLSARRRPACREAEEAVGPMPLRRATAPRRRVRSQFEFQGRRQRRASISPDDSCAGHLRFPGYPKPGQKQIFQAEPPRCRRVGFARATRSRLKEQERAMVRIPILAIILWFAVTGMARAQTSGQANVQAGPASPPAALLSPDTGSSGIAGSSQSVCSTVSGCDPLSVPTSSSANAQAGSVSASTGAAAGTATGASSPSANPETAQQLPGEAPNGAAANSAKSTASATGSSGTPAAASPPLCGPTMQTTTGESLGVFSGILPGGC